MLMLFLALGCLGAADGLAAYSKSTTFEKRGKVIDFGGKLTLDSPLWGANPASLAQYLTPERVVGAAWDPKRVELIEVGRYRLRQSPFNFAVVSISTYVDVDVTQSPDGRIELTSRDIVCHIDGFRSERLDVKIKLRGVLEPVTRTARITGGFDFGVTGTLTGPLQFVPEVALRAASTAVNLSILSYARRRFISGLQHGYDTWRATTAQPRRPNR